MPERNGRFVIRFGLGVANGAKIKRFAGRFRVTINKKTSFQLRRAPVPTKNFERAEKPSRVLMKRGLVTSLAWSDDSVGSEY